MEVVRLDQRPVPDVVALMEHLLARARAGEVIGVAVALACREQCDGSAYVLGEGNIASLVLGLERCKGRLLAHGAE